MKLIDKDALVAEIENLENAYKKIPTSYNSYEEGLKEGRLIGYKDALHKINTLEVKGADLEEEIERVRKTHFINDDFEKATLEGRQITNIAKHFFELGLKVQKGE